MLFDGVSPQRAKPWTSLQVSFNAPTVEIVVFEYKFRVVDILDEEDYDVYEYDGPQLAISEDLYVTADNDIHLINDDDPFAPEDNASHVVDDP